MMRTLCRCLWLWLPCTLYATVAGAGVPQALHRLEGLSHSSYPGFERVTLHLAGGVPDYRFWEEDDGSWTVRLESTVAGLADEEYRGPLLKEVHLDKNGSDLRLRLVSSTLEGMTLQPIVQGDELLLDVLSRVPSQSKVNYYEKGSAALNGGHPHKALEYLRAWLKEHPGHAGAYFEAGRARLELGEIAAARYNFLRAARDSSWRKQVARVLAGLEPPGSGSGDTDSPAKVAEASPADSSLRSSPLVTNSPSREVEGAPSATTQVARIPSVDGSSVFVLIALPLVIALALTGVIAWLLLGKKAIGARCRRQDSRRFEVPPQDVGQPLGIGGEKGQRPLKGLHPEQGSAATGPVEHASRQPRQPMESAHDLFLPLNENETTRMEVVRSRQRLRPSLSQLVEDSRTDPELREVARYLDVGLGEVELARTLARHKRPAKPRLPGGETPTIRFGMVDDEG